MLVKRAQYAQRHLIVTHQNGGKVWRLPQHLQRAGIATLRIPVTANHRDRLQAISLRVSIQLFRRSLADTELSGPASSAISRCPIS